MFDFVGAPPTLETARQSVALNGVIQIVGIGGGLLPTGFFSTPIGASVRAPYWGTRSELMEVLDLARAGAIHVEVERYGLDQAPEAYRKLHDGTIRGRAVVVPGLDREARSLTPSHRRGPALPRPESVPRGCAFQRPEGRVDEEGRPDNRLADGEGPVPRGRDGLLPIPDEARR